MTTYKRWNIGELKMQIVAEFCNRHFSKHPCTYNRSKAPKACPFRQLLNESTINYIGVMRKDMRKVSDHA